MPYRSVSIRIIDEGGTDCLERSVPSEVCDIVACLKGFDHKIEIVGLVRQHVARFIDIAKLLERQAESSRSAGYSARLLDIASPGNAYESLSRGS